MAALLTDEPTARFSESMESQLQRRLLNAKKRRKPMGWPNNASSQLAPCEGIQTPLTTSSTGTAD